MAKRPTSRKTARKKSMKKSAGQAPAPNSDARDYTHPEATSPLRPDVGVQAQFRKKKPAKTYRYDSSLSPVLEWDEQPAREQGETLLAQILEAGSLEEAKAAAEKLKAMSGPFLNWAGKAERQAFDVPTLPLFIHERLSTKAILETVKRHTRDKQVAFDLFGDPKRDLADHVLRAYEHRDRWVNRMILGDSLVVMNSLLEYEGLGGQVQMIYLDPPYGVKFGSNFQPFVRGRNVTHGDDDDFTREPEMVQAYRDTWELGLHSYLAYLRDRLQVARQLLSESGSLFLQIGPENAHLVRVLLDEVFGSENFAAQIVFKKTGASTDELLSSPDDVLLWYARDRAKVKFHPLYTTRRLGDAGTDEYKSVELPSGQQRAATKEELAGLTPLPPGARAFRAAPLTSSHGYSLGKEPYTFRGTTYVPGPNRYWSTHPDGIRRCEEAGRLIPRGRELAYKRYLEDFPVLPLTTNWQDTMMSSRSEDKIYVVQTSVKVIQRCLLACTDPGDLVLDPTCGSGTTAYAAEQWGRRWITVDTSRVPLALARQRLLTASYTWYELADQDRGPAGGFVYRRRQNAAGEEVGGIVPHVTLKSVANEEPPAEEVLVDRPEAKSGITRVTGPFVLEATIPTPVDYEGDGVEDSGAVDGYADFVDRMVEVLRRSPDLRLPGNVAVRLQQVRRPAKTLSLSAEAMVAGNPVAVVFGPENGAVSQKLVYNAGSEARAKGYSHLFVFGFEIEPSARTLVDQAEAALGIPGTYVAATPDLVLGDLLKTMRSSQVFSVTGLPDVKVEKAKTPKGEPQKYQVRLLGLDTFDPATMKLDHKTGEAVPAWFLDTDYDPTRCFRVCQAFFPKTGAWNNLKRELRAEYEESLWDHLSGTTSAPFEAGEQQQVAVKVIDERGNELLVAKPLPQ
jgi:adenine-specific DNA-methyltransferase